ncbi:MAG: copper-translocating P-type ATPase [Candidatus Spechtbacterales bacterium]|nr:copper-translocating P-type ATPase [Candidatus Spechtbacterales bacterium]
MPHCCGDEQSPEKKNMNHEEDEQKDHDHGGHGNHDDHGDHSNHHAMMVEDFKRRFWVSLALSIPVLLLAPVIQSFLGIDIRFAESNYFALALATIIYIWGGKPFLTGLRDELKSKNPGMMTLVAVGISTAYFYSVAVVFGLEGKQLLWELVTLVDVMLLGHWIEMRSVMGASKALEELAKLLPSTAHRLNKDGETEDVPIEELEVGDKVLIKPGEKVPVDGVVVEGASSTNESMLTGETKPVEKEEGSEVIAGAVNGDGSLTVEIKKIGKDTYLSQISDLVASAQKDKSKTQDLANRAAVWLTAVALGGGVVTLFSWLLFTSQDFGFALERTIAVIVIACPHALGLAIPLVVMFSTGLGAKNGLLIRNRTAFEKARNINAIILDKTGTLTKGEFAVSDIKSFGAELDTDEVLMYAASVDSSSAHPISKAIVAASNNTKEVKDFKQIQGKGAEGVVDGKNVKVLSLKAAGELNESVKDEEAANSLAKEGKTLVVVFVEEKSVGIIALDDVVREESKDAIARLKELGIKTIMLTGDNEAVAKRISEEVGIDDYVAEVMPEEKSEKVKEIQNEGYTVAMVGDGVNDAPALAQADVGIAIGAGTDVAIEAGDIVLVKSNPADIVKVITLANKTYSKMIQNLWWAAGYNIFAMPAAGGALYWAGIVFSPAIGAVLMSLSTVIVAFNATLLKKSI